MPSETIVVSEVIPATRDRLYAAWMSSEEHSAFTGDRASIDPRVGGRCKTFGGDAIGANVDLVPGERIVQTWRTSQFPSDAPNSRVEITFEETMGGTLLTIQHSDIPPGQGAACADGWIRRYLEPMRHYYDSAGEAVRNGVPGAPVRKAAAEARKPTTKAKPRGKGKVTTRPRAKAKAKRKAAPKRNAKPKAKAAKPKAKAAKRSKPKKASKPTRAKTTPKRLADRRKRR